MSLNEFLNEVLVDEEKITSTTYVEAGEIVEVRNLSQFALELEALVGFAAASVEFFTSNADTEPADTSDMALLVDSSGTTVERAVASGSKIHIALTTATVGILANYMAVKAKKTDSITINATNNLIYFEEETDNPIIATITPATYTEANLRTEIKTQMESAADDAPILIVVDTNDKIDFEEESGNELTAVLTAGQYTTTTLAAEAKSKMETAADNAPIVVSAGTNDKIDFEETGGVELTATLTAGSYTPATFCVEVKTQLDTAGASTYTVTYNDVTRKYTIVSDMVGGGNIFSLLFLSGTHNADTACALLGFTKTDKTGIDNYDSNFAKPLGSNYTITYSGVTRKFTIASDGAGVGGAAIFSLLWLSGSHNADTACDTFGFDKVDETAALTYDSDNAKALGSNYTITYSSSTNKFTIVSDGGGGTGIFTLLNSLTTNSIAPVLGFNTTDKSGALTYTSDVSVGAKLSVRLIGK